MFLIFWYDLKTLINKRLITAIIALLFVGFFAGIFISSKFDGNTIQSDTIVVGVLDEDQSEYSKMILNFLDGSAYDSYINIVYKEEEQTLIELINDNKMDMYIVIPINFVQNIINIENTPVRVVINNTDISKSILIKSLLESYEKYIEAVQISCVTLYDIMADDNMTDIDIDAANTAISLELVATVLDKDSFFNRVKLYDMVNIPINNYYGYELIFLLIVYISMAYGIRIMKERQAGIILRITSTGMNTIWYIAGKLLFMQVVFIISFAIAFFIKFYNTKLFDYKGCLLCIFTALVCLAVFTTLSIMFNTMKSYLLASNMFIIFSVILGGGIIPVLYLPETMADIAKYMPNYRFITLMYEISDSALYSYIICCCLITITLAFICRYVYERKEGVPSDV